MEIISRIIYNLMEVHPLHTLLIHFPIALTSAALFFILLALWKRNDALEQVAFANIALAAVSTVAAGVTGYLDNNRTYAGAAPNADTKIVLAVVLFFVTALVAIARWRKPDIFHSVARYPYVAGYFISFGLVAVLGFLGGVILYGFEDVPSAIMENPTPESVALVAHIATPTPGLLAATEEAATRVSLAKDILPVLKARCINCHGGQKTEEGLNLTSYAMLMAGSDNGPVVLSGDANKSLLAKSLLEKEMPKRGPKLSPEQVQFIIDWINQGALDN